jgi:hypothetical protein
MKKNFSSSVRPSLRLKISKGLKSINLLGKLSAQALAVSKASMSTMVAAIAVIAFVTLFVIVPTHADARTISLSTVTPNTTVGVGVAVAFNITSDDGVRLTYTVSDSLAGSTISNSNISIVGALSWTPQTTDIGTHNLIITTTDMSGVKNTYYQTLTVTAASAVSIVSLSPGSSVLPINNNAVSFSITTQGYVNPSFYLLDNFTGGSGVTSISSSNIDSSGNVIWTPKGSDVGTHNLTIRVYGSNGRQDVVYQNIVVNGITVSGISSGVAATAYAGLPFSFSANLYGLSHPSYIVGDDFRNNTLDSTTISNNSFSWTPTNQDVGKHTITITASENSNVVRTSFVVNVIPTTSSVVTANTNPTVTAATVTTSNASSNSTPSVNASASTAATAPVYANASATAKYIFKSALAVGSKGTEVTELQKRLKTLGVYTGPVTGNFATLTKAAVIKYQGIHGIAKQGNVGPATRAALNK